MGTTERDILVEIPRDDGGIGEALADLQTRIAAWTQAIGQVHNSLTAAVTRAAEAPAPAEAPKVVELPPSNRPAAATAGKRPASAAPAPVSKTGEAAPSEPKLRPSKIKKLIGSKGGTTNPADLDRFAFKEETPPEPQQPATVDEDEALLASLDPKKAREIRIKRRLCNNKKSVRELLEEG
jgi:hypothetical protein